ncbi:MAG TPA: helix-turn-helix domain-containing protein [Nocardia sp.]|uniref:TetR/AcrR family transcriptional regulator n=1 Tax=Nocardia sp. TaxID=1821 RepID=UPI002B4AF564|nr:helix-turn-helix domain-containing protein [Nocardia sp.]HLS76852.1 helix-turn-helix domain-containing protein [Nocardia sp.]
MRASPRTGRRRSAARDGDARELVLDAAENLFAAQGFDATPTSAVAAAAGIPKGLLFYYFPTKDAILSALVAERARAQPVPDLDAVVAPGDPATSLVRLHAALNPRDRRSSLLRVILWREAGTHPDVRRQLRRMRDHLLETTARVLQASAPAPVEPRTLRACALTWVSAVFTVTAADRPHALDGLPVPTAEEILGVARVVAAGLTGSA